ncbi:putative phage abortive infection protein [Bacteroidota bacterium]
MRKSKSAQAEKTGKKTDPMIRFSYEKIAFALIWAGLIVIFLAFLTFIFRETHFLGITKESFEILGQFGEYIGGIVGSVWALAGVILFYETLRFQRRELKLQREELQNQREDNMEQTQQYILQNQTLMTRKLEGTFFQLLSLHNSTVDSLILNFKYHPSLKGSGKAIIQGRYCFNHFYRFYTSTFHDYIDVTGIVSTDTEDMRELLNETFEKFYQEFHEDIGHYFRNLFNLGLFVNQSNLYNKKFYFNLIRSMLSNYELVLLFYFCLSNYGKNMKSLIEKYSLFVQLPASELIDRRHMDLFDKKAFEENYLINI